MPFQVSVHDTSRPQPRLRVLDYKYFRLEDPFVYVHGDTVVHVPECEGPGPVSCTLRTDLASVPAPLRGLLTPYGRQLLPSVMHDDLSKQARSAGSSGMNPRRRADELFRLALLDEGVGRFRSRLFWVGVEVGRYWDFTRFLRYALIGQHVLGMLCWVVGVPAMLIGDHMVFALGLAVLPVLSALLWRSDFLVALLGCVILPLVAPMYLLTIGTAAVLWIPDGVAWLFGRRRTTTPPPLGPPTNVLGQARG